MKSKIRETEDNKNEPGLTDETLGNSELSDSMVSFVNDLNENSLLNSTSSSPNFSENNSIKIQINLNIQDILRTEQRLLLKNVTNYEMQIED